MTSTSNDFISNVFSNCCTYASLTASIAISLSTELKLSKAAFYLGRFEMKYIYSSAEAN